MKQNWNYLCTRPRLAARLIGAGFEAKETTNPWHPTLMAWEFSASVDLCHAVATFYEEIGKPVPKTVSDFLKESGAV